MSDLKQLVKMANQIAENFSFHEDAVGQMADHLQRFWAPSMRNDLMKFLEEGGEGLKPAAITAIRQLSVE